MIAIGRCIHVHNRERPWMACVAGWLAGSNGGGGGGGIGGCWWVVMRAINWMVVTRGEWADKVKRTDRVE